MDDGVAAHASLRRRYHRFMGSLDLGVAITTIHSELAGMQAVAVVDRLFGRVANLQVGWREVDPKQYEHACSKTTGNEGQGQRQVVQLAGENLHAAVSLQSSNRPAAM